MVASRVVYAGSTRALAARLAQRLGEGSLEREAPRSRRLVELDTVDRGLEGAGGSLTWEDTGSGGTLEWIEGDDPPARVACAALPEFAWEVEPGPVRRSLSKAAGVRRMVPLWEVERNEGQLRWVDAHGKTVARVRILRERFRPAGTRGSWSVPREAVVAEPIRGWGAAHDELVAALDGVESLQQTDEAYLSSRPASVLPVVFAPPAAWPSVDRAEPAARALRRIVLRQLEVAEAQESGLRADLDSEFNHDLRVAVRRTRSLFAQLKRALGPREVDDLRVELAWIGRATGPLRDLDVLLLELHALGPELPVGLQSLTDLLEERRRDAHAELVAALDTRRWTELRARWRRWTESAAAPDGPPFGVLVADRIDRLRRRILRDGRRLGADAPAVDLHALRIECKKLRYVAECARDAVQGEHQRRCVRSLKGLQELLGDFNDSRVQALELERLAVPLADRAPLALLPLGRLVERRRAGERESRARFAERFEAFASRRSRRDFVRLGAALRGQEASSR